MFLLADNYRHVQFQRGLRDQSMVAPGIAAWGLMTGVAMVQSGQSTLEALLMSLLVFAGSAQLAAVPLMASGAPLWVILLTAFCVNLRFVVFSAHMRPYMMHLPLRQRLICGYLTGDLSYVQFVRRFPAPGGDQAQLRAQQAYLAGNCALNWLAWVGASVLGVFLANWVPARWGLGFAGILALIGVACSLLTSRLKVVSAAISGAAAVAAFALPLKLNILLAIAVAVAMCLLLEQRQGAQAEVI